MPELPEENQTTAAAAVGTKRQRRPSVRLGDLGGGDLISSYYLDPLLPRQHRRQQPSKTRRRQQPLKVGKESLSDAANDVDNCIVSRKSKKGLKSRSVDDGNVEEENEADLDGVAIGSWKGRVSGLRGGRIGSNGKRGDRDNVGSKLVGESRNGSGDDENVEADEGDLDGVAIGSWKGRVPGLRGGRIGGNGKRGNMSNLGCKLVGEIRNESGDDDVDRNFEPIQSEEEEDREENHDDSSPVHSFDKDSSDDGDGNENIGGRGEDNGAGKGRDGKDLRFQVSDEMEDPSDLSERNGVKMWLKKLGLQRYALNFEIHEVDDEVLPLLTLEDLKDMGITAVGPRRKMFCAIQNFNKGYC